MAHRAHLHTQLKDAAMSSQGEWKSARIHTSSRVMSVDAQNAIITLENGTSHVADVVIGADGVHSKTRRFLTPDATPEAIRGRHSAFRFIIKREAVLQDPDIRSFAEIEGSMDLWYSTDRKVVLYPTTYNQLLNFACIHPAELSASSLTKSTDEFTNAASKSTLLEVYKDFHPKVRKLLEMADPATLKVYPLFDMENLPTFVSGRLALLGDAAHPFTPHLAQGGAMAIEDGASLGVFLDRSTTRSEVPERLELYNLARYKRASQIQEYSRQVGGDGTAKDGQSDAQFKGKGLRSRIPRVYRLKLSTIVHEYLEYALSHDEIHASTQILREHKWKRHAHRWRQPLVFGPLPGPRQDAYENSYRESLRNSTTTKAVVKFKTSATLLRGLFPNSKYFFQKPDTVATASYSIEALENMAWLGGGGYALVAFYVHGVNYREDNGQVRKGVYCPIMFENLTDPILTGREELGVSKMFSDIDITRSSESSFVTKVSWRGAIWGEFELKNLQKREAGSVQTEESESEGVLLHKYIPGTGTDKPDADYDVLLMSDLEKLSVKSFQTASPADVRFEINKLGWEQLPTLHSVISRLAELPVIEISEGSLAETQGVTDLSNMLRLT